MEKLYELLFDSGDYTKSYEEFVQQYGDAEKSKVLYKGLNDAGDYTKSFEEFTSQYGFNKEVKKKRLFSITWYFSRGKYGFRYTGRSGSKWVFGFFRGNS